MARVEITLETDGGAEMVVIERSAVPVVGGAPAAVLVQAAYIKIMAALGVTSGPAEQEGDTPAADTTDEENKP